MWKNSRFCATAAAEQKRGGKKSPPPPLFYRGRLGHYQTFLLPSPHLHLHFKTRDSPNTQKTTIGETESIVPHPRRTNSGPDLLKEVPLLLLLSIQPLWGFLSVCPEEGIWILGLDRQFSTTPPTPKEEGGKLFSGFGREKVPSQQKRRQPNVPPPPPEQPTQKRSFSRRPHFSPQCLFLLLLLLKYTPSPIFLPSIPPHPFSRNCSRKKKLCPPPRARERYMPFLPCEDGKRNA